jgi:hypothetical protein
MKRLEKSMLAIVSLGFALSSATALASGSGGTGTPANRQESGDVQSVDLTKGSVTLLARGESFGVSSSTEIIKDCAPARLSDIRPGDHVEATFISDDPTNAYHLYVSSPGFRVDRSPASC